MRGSRSLWSLLAQPHPLPEVCSPQRRTPSSTTRCSAGELPGRFFEPGVRAAYAESLRDFRHAHAVAEDYRAAATIDREHDQADLRAARRLAYPLLVLWSREGPLGSWYQADSGPLGVWKRWADDVQGHAVEAGHFFPEEIPEHTADVVGSFLAPESHAR